MRCQKPRKIPVNPEANPLLQPWQTPFETPPFAEICPEHFLPAFEQAFADHAAEIAAITHDPAAPDFANTITALERSGKLLSKVSAVFYDLVSAQLQSGDPRDRQGGLAADGAALEPDHDERGAVRPDRAARTSNRATLGPDGRADAPAGAHLQQLPPRRRRPRRGRQEAAGRDQRAAGAARHLVQPPSARRRAGLVHGARRGRSRRPVRRRSSPRPRLRRKSAGWPARRS